MKINKLVLVTKQGAALCARSSVRSKSVLRDAFSSTLAQLGLFRAWLPVIAGLIVSPFTVAAPATLAWNANPEADISGYILKYGKSTSSLVSTIDAGNKTSIVVPDLEEGTPYFFTISAYNRSGLNSGDSTAISHTIPVTPPAPNPMAKTLLRYVNSEEATNYPASNAFDGDPNTFWHTNWKNGPVPPPHEIQLDLGTVERMNGFTYLPRQDAYNNGNVGEYEFFVSLDGTNWGSSVASGTFENTKDLKQISFNPKSGRYVRLRALTEANGYEYAAIAELTVLTLPKDQSNLAPTATAQNLTTAEDTPLALTLGGNDPEGTNLTFTIVSPPTKGTLTGIAPNLTYTPPADFSGSISLTFRANDGDLDSALGTISIAVSPVNDAPSSIAASFSTVEDNAVPILLSGIDKEGNPLTFAIVAGPASGTLTGTPPNLIFTPAADFNGTTSFSFRANDGTTNSAPATVSITVTPVNDAPTAIARSISTDEDTSVQIVLTGSDKEGNPLTFVIVTGPANGTLTGTPPNVTFNPAADFNGITSFSFRANDGTTNSTPATVSITVTPVNDAPTAIARSVSTAENTALPVLLTGSDKEANPLTFAIVAGPTNGTLTGTPPNLTFTPAADFYGSTSFTFRSNDGTTNSAPATISITVTPVNDAPTAIARSISTQEDTSVPIVLTGSDKEGNPLTFTIVTGPANGTLSGNPPNLTFAPAADFNGSTSFTFRANDGIANSAPATVSITVTPVNDAPSAIARSVSTTEDSALPILLTGSDKEGSPLSFVLISGPATGTLSGAAPNLTYTPPADFNGSASFTFRVNDGTLDSTPATISIVVSQVNDAPIASAASVSTLEDTALPIALTGSDKEGNPLTFAIVTGPANGTLTGTPPNLIFTPAADFNGSASFTFHTNDGTTNSAPATVSITVTPVNDAPTAIARSVSTAENTALPIVLTGSDKEANALTFVIVAGPANGTLTGTPPNLTFTPAADFDGSTSFTFRSNDGTTNSAPSTISITVTPGPIKPVNNAPRFSVSPIVGSTTENKAFFATLSATDPDAGDTLTFSKASGPTWLTVTPSGTMSGTPAAINVGTNQFVVAVSDSKGGTATASLTITVAKTNSAPFFLSNPVILASAEVGLPYLGQTLVALAQDADKSDTLTFSKLSGPAWLNVASNGAIGGTPPEGSTGLNSFVVRVTDQVGAGGNATLEIQVAEAGIPLPWSLDHLGTTNLVGSATFDDGTFTFTGSGSFFSNRDTGNFCWQTLSGDGEIIARLAKFESRTNTQRVGVTIRESLASNARSLFLGITGDGNYRWYQRSTAGGSTSFKSSINSEPADAWLRLTREGDSISAFKSTDGTAWSLVNRITITLPENCYIGMLTNSGNDKTLLNSNFSNLKVTP